MAPDRPEIQVRPAFAGSAVVFEVRVLNPMPVALRRIRLQPRSVPETIALDRTQHLIPLLKPRASRTVQFRARPNADQMVVALDLAVEWEDERGGSRGRLETSSQPVDLTCPELGPPSVSIDRWRGALRGGAAIEVRMRAPEPPPEVLAALEDVLKPLPGELVPNLEEGPRGPMGRIWLRGEGARGRVVGLLVEVTPDPKTGGSRVLVTASASTEELLARFYLLCLGVLRQTLPGIEGREPVSLVEGP